MAVATRRESVLGWIGGLSLVIGIVVAVVAVVVDAPTNEAGIVVPVVIGFQAIFLGGVALAWARPPTERRAIIPQGWLVLVLAAWSTLSLLAIATITPRAGGLGTLIGPQPEASGSAAANIVGWIVALGVAWSAAGALWTLGFVGLAILRRVWRRLRLGRHMTAFPPLVVIAGPTATGKTGLSIRLAEALAGEGTTAEIISADSRQVYRGLDIGTAKVSVADRARIPHHGLDLVDPDVRFTVADFVRRGRKVLAGIAERRAIAILVGGTGLYLRALAGGLDPDALPSDPALRDRLEAELLAHGLPSVVARLTALAPEAAARTDLRNPRRVVRALEIAELSGDKPPPRLAGYPGPVAWIGLDTDIATHRSWIADRARGQFEGGLIEEARTLRERWDPSLPAFSAIGYREAWAAIDGELDLDAAVELDTSRTVAFARRQRTWFRKESGMTWLDPARREPLEPSLEIARSLVVRT